MKVNIKSFSVVSNLNSLNIPESTRDDSFFKSDKVSQVGESNGYRFYAIKTDSNLDSLPDKLLPELSKLISTKFPHMGNDIVMWISRRSIQVELNVVELNINNQNYGTYANVYDAKEALKVLSKLVIGGNEGTSRSTYSTQMIEITKLLKLK